MRLLLYASFALDATANIVFNHVPLTCDPNSDVPVQGMTGCLRGQTCTERGTCKRDDSALYSASFSRVPRAAGANIFSERETYSTGGKCGPKNENLKCDPNGVYGPCCSQYGFCGSDVAHCGDGCTSGCKLVQSKDTTAPRGDGRCGSTYGGATCDLKGPFGGCCSVYGFCGSTPQH